MLLNPTCWLFKLRHMMWHKQRLAKVYEFNPMGADRVQVFFSKREAVSSSFPPFDLWHFSHHVNGRKEVQDMKQITGWAEAPALQWRCLFFSLSFARGNGPFPWNRPTLQLCHPGDRDIVSRYLPEEATAVPVREMAPWLWELWRDQTARGTTQ